MLNAVSPAKALLLTAGLAMAAGQGTQAQSSVKGSAVLTKPNPTAVAHISSVGAGESPDVGAARKQLALSVKGIATFLGRTQIPAGGLLPGGAIIKDGIVGAHAGADGANWRLSSGTPTDASLPVPTGTTHAVVVATGFTDYDSAWIGIGGDRRLPLPDSRKAVSVNGVINGAAGAFTVSGGTLKFGFSMSHDGAYREQKRLCVTSLTVYSFLVK